MVNNTDFTQDVETMGKKNTLAPNNSPLTDHAFVGSKMLKI